MSPLYEYIDENKHVTTITEPMVTSVTHICMACGLSMWRKPTVTMVNWNGLKPSAGEMSTNIRNLINGAPQRRDEYEAKHGGD